MKYLQTPIILLCGVAVWWWGYYTNEVAITYGHGWGTWFALVSVFTVYVAIVWKYCK